MAQQDNNRNRLLAALAGVGVLGGSLAIPGVRGKLRPSAKLILQDYVGEKVKPRSGIMKLMSELGILREPGVINYDEYGKLKQLPNLLKRDGNLLFLSEPVHPKTGIGKGLIQGARANLPYAEDKWKEYLAMRKLLAASIESGAIIPKDVLPETISLAGRKSLSGVRDPKHLREYLSKRLGDKWILKARDGAATLPDDIITESSTDRILKNIINRKNLSNYIAQSRYPMASPGKLVNKFDKVLERNTGDALSGIIRGSHEYRIHVADGRVIPYASVHRGSASPNILSYIMPGFMDFKRRRAERLVNDLFSATRVPGSKFENHRKGVFGMDVGIRKDGKPFIIETNPSSSVKLDRDGNLASGIISSGFLQKNPVVQEAVIAHASGQTPGNVILRRGALASSPFLGYSALASPQS